MPSPKTVLLIATLDTKGEEAAFLRKAIESRGKKVLVLDPGLRGEPRHCTPDFELPLIASNLNFPAKTVSFSEDL